MIKNYIKICSQDIKEPVRFMVPGEVDEDIVLDTIFSVAHSHHPDYKNQGGRLAEKMEEKFGIEDKEEQLDFLQKYYNGCSFLWRDTTGLEVEVSTEPQDDEEYQEYDDLKEVIDEDFILQLNVHHEIDNLVKLEDEIMELNLKQEEELFLEIVGKLKK